MSSNHGNPSAPRGLARLSRDPFAHFVALSLSLFVANHALAKKPVDEHVISIPASLKDDLARDLESTTSRPPTPGEIDAALERWKTEEVMYREALRLKLDANDSAIRKHLVAKARDAYLDQETLTPTGAELDNWLETHRQSYLGPEQYDFEYVTVAPSASDEKTRANAEALRASLAAGAKEKLTRVERSTFKQIARRFTPKFASDLVRSRDWHVSKTPDGWHVARLTARYAGKLPARRELRPRLIQDWQRANRDRLADRVLERVAKDYRFVDEAGPSPRD